MPASQAALNPRWVLGTLRQRGMPEPPLNVLQAAIRSLDVNQLNDLRSRVSRLNAGSDTADDMQWVSDWCANAQKGGEAAQHEAANDQGETADDGGLRSAAPGARRGQSYEASHRVYGSKAALCLEPVQVEASSGGHGDDSFWTLQLEGAPAITRRRYDWEHKIIFRLTQRELALFAAALLGWCKNLEFKGHGPGNDKILELKDQGPHLFIKLRQGRKAYAVQLGGDEVFPATAMALKALGRNAAHLDSQTLVQLVKRAGEMYGRATAVREESQ